VSHVKFVEYYVWYCLYSLFPGSEFLHNLVLTQAATPKMWK